MEVEEMFFFLNFQDATAPSGPGPPLYPGFKITLRRTKLGRASLDEWSAQRRDIYLRTHKSMSPAGFGNKIQQAS